MTRLGLLLASTLALLAGGCGRALEPRPPGQHTTPAPPVSESIYQRGLSGRWSDQGWAEKERKEGGHERLRLEREAGWMLVNDRLKGAWGGLTFRFRAPPEWGDFLELRLDQDGPEVLPRVAVQPSHRRDLPDGWSEVFVPIEELDPDLLPFTRVILRAARPLPPPGVVEFDELGLTEANGVLVSRAEAAQYTPGVPAAMVVDCESGTTPISPFIYGVAFSPRKELAGNDQWKVMPAIRRWGGPESSRYNWELGRAWNGGVESYFENADLVGSPDFSWRTFLDVSADRRVKSAVTLPMLGWVARDITSAGFPISEFGRQQREDVSPKRMAGNGVQRGGKPLRPGSPARTSVPAGADFVGRWVQAIEAHARKRGAGVAMYFLDREPGLWHDTHRDVHPQPVTTDELLQRTVAYATAVRKADPAAVIAGPSEWGWTGYLYSAADSVAGFAARPDRRAHGDLPAIASYLRGVAEAEKKTGLKLLDVFDLHFFPQAMGVGVGAAGRTDPETSALRIRSTRALWDPRYVDESFIQEPIQLIPRMREWVASYRPGLKLSIGEYSFGAEGHLSGGLAQAEALGRFGQEGLYAAFTSGYPAEGTPAFWAFRAYRDFDGHGAAFEENAMPTRAPRDTSVFAARSADGTRATLVMINFSTRDVFDARVSLQGCAPYERQRVFAYTGDPRGFTAREVRPGSPYRLAPSSITVVELLADRQPRRPR